MKVFRTVVTILAFFILIPQTVRNVYVRWFEPRESVLDKYKQPMKANIQAADSLDELLEMYEKAHKEGAATGRPGGTQPYAPAPVVSPYVAPPSAVTYAPPVPGAGYSMPTPEEMNLEHAIQEWEAMSNKIYQLRFYWCFGLLLVLAGVVVHKFSPWPGLVLRIIGFSEMIYWTTPSYMGWGRGTQEADKLFENRLVFSLLTLLLLSIVVFFGRTFWNLQSVQKANPSP